ncbi:hypothetical protein F5Y11DRAFT_3145 [Daldinia sp. FL1419]|nr:hypothetical protein F5Y11DRAFT_3145 [Daldinia sp. FL1419]
MADNNISIKFEQSLSLESSKGAVMPPFVLNLPVELISHILSFLELECVLHFSLTCKDLFCVVRDSQYNEQCLAAVSKLPRERTEFLRILAKDLPQMFVCQRCSKLHRNLVGLHKDGPLNLMYSVSIRSMRRRHGLMTFGDLWPQYSFSREQGRQAIKNQSNPLKKHSLATSHLAISTDWELRRLGTSCNNPTFIHGYVKLNTEAVVVNGTLRFHKIQRILLLADRLKPFLRGNCIRPMEQVFQSCHHGTQIRETFRPEMNSNFDWSRFTRSNVRETITGLAAMANNSAPGGARLMGHGEYDRFRRLMPPRRVYSPTACRRCTTENATTIHNHGLEGVEIVIDVYQDLGNCIDDLAQSQDGERSDNKWGHCWPGLGQEYESPELKREPFNFLAFPTPPGKSALTHRSAPDIYFWNLDGYEREVRERFHRRSLKGN